ncbi:MAG: hypothetical protein AAF632_06120 [Bacteroidota bacterium]
MQKLFVTGQADQIQRNLLFLFFRYDCIVENDRTIEDRITERLLAEMLRKQDQQTELLSRMVASDEKQNKIPENHSGILKEHSGILKEHSGILNKLVEGQNTIVEKMNESTANAEYNFKLVVGELKALREDLNRLDEFEQRWQILERKVG